MAILGAMIGLLFGEAGVQALESPFDQLLGITMLIAYYVFFEGIWNRTPGKFVFGTIVVSESGGKPSIGQIIGRSLCRFIPFERFSCLSGKGWHDTIPKTKVVLYRVP